MAKMGFRSHPPRVSIGVEQASPTPVPSKEVDELRKKRQGLNDQLADLRGRLHEAKSEDAKLRQKLQEEIAKRRTLIRSISLQISNAEAV